MNRRLTATFVGALLLAAGTVSAQDFEWLLGGRAIYMTGGATSPEVGNTGDSLELGASGGVEFDAVARFSEMFAAEFTIGATLQSLTAISDGIGGGDIDGGWFWLFPLTATAQFHIPIYGSWDPYLGVGIAWTYPYADLSSDIKNAGVKDIDFKGTVGVAAQGGVNYSLNNRWYANLDVRYLGVSVEATVTTDDGKLEPVDLDIKPWVFGVGFGYRF